MKKAYWSEIWRSIKKSKKRFLSIMIITALGVTVLTGIYAACQDMYRSADLFYDEQHLFDIRIQSTLGLTDDDVQALRKVAGIEEVAGAYSETVHTDVNGAAKDVELAVLGESHLNAPLLQQGALPARSGEIAVTQRYLDDTGKAIGDTVTITEDLDEADGGEAIEETVVEDPPGEDEDGGIDIDWDADIEIEKEAEEPTFPVTTFTITGVVLSPMDISNGSVAFRSAASTDYSFFISSADAVYDVYSSVYITLAGLRGLNCYSEEYSSRVQAVIDLIESQIMRQREQARYDDVMAEASERIADAENTMNEKFAEADEAFADAWEELEDARRELLDGEIELTQEEKDALQKLADARAELEDGKRKLDEAEAQLAEALKKLQDGQAEYEKGLAEYEANRAGIEALAQGVEYIGRVDTDLAGILTLFGNDLNDPDGTGLAQFTQAIGAVTGTLDGMAEFYTAAGQGDMATLFLGYSAAIQGSLAVENGAITPDYRNVQAAVQTLFSPVPPLPDSPYAIMAATMAEAKAQLAEGWNKLAEGKRELDDGWVQYYEGVEQIREARAELLKGEEELNREEAKALREIADAWQEIADGKEELADGEAELVENEEKYAEKRAEAEEKLADAWAELADIDMAEWYVQDRTSLDSYASLKSDMSSIEAVGTAFPILFLVVAVLISLTTMTRMVEEERGLIGSYKALGFESRSIYAKYLFYAFAACLLGGLLGDFFGFVLLPALLINILQVLYTLPHVALSFDFVYGVGGILLFVASIVASTALACHRELAQMPAALLRPKAPRAGSRIALERLAFVWNRLRFLNKVTARNLFRYKKRMFMTVLGIMGCTALVLAGFAIRDSVTDLEPKQYKQTYLYDVMVVTNAEDNGEWVARMQGDASVTGFLNLQIGSFKVIGGGGSAETVQLLVVPNGESIDGYIGLRDTAGQPVQLDDSGLLLTQNAAELLSVGAGGSITLQNLTLDRRTATVAGVVQNYLGNNVYMTQSYYESLFDDYAPNGVLAMLSPQVENQAAYAEALLEDSMVLSAVSIEASRADFASNFTLLNSVVYLLIALAAGLAFVVLFTLANTNISERVRELATIKVLGFYNREVHSYVNKETLILTLLGILVGLPVGRFVSGLLTAALKMPSLYFAVYVRPTSYLIAAALSLCFALIVNVMTDRSLDRINMVEALKSVE